MQKYNESKQDSNKTTNSLFSYEEEKFAKHSLFCLKEDNKYRRIAQKIVASKLFIKTMHVIIILNCIFLIFDTISSLKVINKYSNVAFTVIFILECILKIIAYGFIIEDYSYLRDPWNWLDFMVVITGIISFLPSVSANLLALSTFRLIRPIKAMSIVPSMRLFLSTLFHSLIDLLNVFLLLLFFFLIFGVFGLSLWSDTFYSRCRINSMPINGQFPIVEGYEYVLCGGEVKCPTGTYCVNGIKYYPQLLNRTYLDNQLKFDEFNHGLTNFKNILNSLFVVFMATTSEGWVKIMGLMMDGHNYYASFIYFILCVVINYFFMLNLIVAVLIYNLEESRSYMIIDEHPARQSKKKGSKITIMNMHNYNEDTKKRKYRRQYIPFRLINRETEVKGLLTLLHKFKTTQWIKNIKQTSQYHKKCLIGFYCYYIYKQPIMQYFFFFCIIINTLILTLDRENMGNVEYQIIEKINIVLVSIFLFELLIHILGVNLLIFFCNLFNVLDFIIVSFSLIEIILKQSTDILSGTTGSIVTIFRTLRILRVFKLFPQWQHFQIIMESIWQTLIRMVDYIILFLLFVYIYTLLGFSLFNSSMKDNNFNFVDFPESISTVFYLIIGDHWNDIFINAYRSKENNKAAVIIYFITIILLGHITLVNIFLAYLIENFEHSRQHLEKNLIVKSYIINICYYYTYHQQLLLEEENRRKNNEMNNSNKILYLTDVLMKVIGKNYCNYSQLSLLNKTKLDFINMKKKPKILKDENNLLNFKMRKEFDFETEMQKATTQAYIDIDEEEFFNFENDYYDDPRAFYLNEIQIENSPELFKQNTMQTPKNVFTFFNNSEHKRNANSIQKKPKKETLFNSITRISKISDKIRLKKAQTTNLNANRNKFYEDEFQHIPTKKFSLIKQREDDNKNKENQRLIQLSNIYIKKERIWKYMKESSLFIFHFKSKFRLICKKTIRHKMFDYTIFVLILGNCVLISFDSPWVNPESKSSKVMNIFNIIFNILFIIEGMLKIISDDFIYKSQEEKSIKRLASTNQSFDLSVTKSLAFDKFHSTYNKLSDQDKEQYIKKTLYSINNQKAYLLNLANFIDFICIIIGIIDLSNSNITIRSIRALRVFRAIKPLRLIFRCTNLHLIIKCLVYSFPSVWNVFVVCGIVIYIFALLGVNIFKNKLLYYCSDFSSKEKESCLANGSYWLYNYENFQNFPFALKTLFEIMIKDGWGEMMNSAARRYGSKWVFFYYIIFIIISHLFILNLFVSILVQKFKLIKKDDKKFRMLSEPEKEWIKVQKIMLKFRPIIKTSNMNNQNRQDKLYRYLESFVLSKWFNYIIFTLIFLSIITLLMQYSGSSSNYNNTIEFINIIFTILFNIELILKIIVIRKSYIYSSWNRFDLIIIILSDILVILNILSRTGVVNIQTMSSFPVILRAFRILQIFRVLSSFSHIRALISTLIYLIPTIVNIGLLMLLLLLVYGNIGMSIFGTVPFREIITSNLNFKNFLSSSLLLFQATAGEDWNKIMNELAYHDCRDNTSVKYQSDYYCVKYNITCYDEKDVNYSSLNANERFSCGNEFSYFYCISFIILCPIFVMNLCVVMVIEGFADSMYENEGLLSEEYMDKFVSVWMEYDPSFEMMIKPHEFVLILKELGPPLGFNYDRHLYLESGKMIREKQRFLICKSLIEANGISNNDRTHNFIFRFNSFYLSKNKKFYTNDVEVLKIVEKLNITAAEYQGSNKQYSNQSTKRESIPTNNPRNNTSNSNNNNKQSEWNNLRIHFIEACLALSRFAISKTQNISFNNLRFNVVNTFTKNMWKNNYCNSNKDIASSFLDSKKREAKGSLSTKLAAKIIYDKTFKYLIEKARKRINERNKENDIFITFENQENNESNNACCPSDKDRDKTIEMNNHYVQTSNSLLMDYFNRKND